MTMIEAPVAVERSFVASDTISPAIAELIDRVGPSVVEVRGAERGGGAGVIWRADGAILTNNHVVAHVEGAIKVVLPDGPTFDATVVAGNPALDLALLSVAASDLAAAPIGDSSRLRVGELVFAIGHPWGRRGVVTAGIVSGLGAVPVGNNGRTAQYIRTDVRLAPGNSGGPLLNAQGAVVGINAMIFGGDLAVAIPSHVASAWAAGLSGRQITLGVQVQQVELPALAGRAPESAQAAGLLLIGLTAGGAADRAGLLVGDVVLDAAGMPTETADALRDILAHSDAAQPLRIHVLRGGVVQAIEVNLDWTERGA